MDFSQAVTAGFSRYVDFKGRSRRSEFWWWTLFEVIALTGAFIAGEAASLNSSLYGLTALALFLPGLAVQVRRLHDTDRSGWWLLLSLVPVVGIIVLIVWWCTPGTRGFNSFGADPVDPTAPAEPPLFGAPVAPAPAPSFGTTVAASPSATDPLDRLEQLGRLRDQGLLTDEEFTAEKTRLLGRTS